MRTRGLSGFKGHVNRGLSWFKRREESKGPVSLNDVLETGRLTLGVSTLDNGNGSNISAEGFREGEKTNRFV